MDTSRHDIFSPGDLTALVCSNDSDVEKVIGDQLVALDYKIHTGLFEDISQILATHVYNVVVFHFEESNEEFETKLLPEINALPSHQRRDQFMVVISPNVETSNEMQAFLYGIDLLINAADLASLKLLVYRGLTRQEEFYAPLKSCVRREEQN